MKAVPLTLQDAIKHFSDFENCREFMVHLRWPDGKVQCPRCGSERVVWLAKAHLFKCYEKHQRPKFSLKTGTVLEDSAIGLDKWLVAVWLIVNCKNGISSYEISRDLGVTQKTAWFMLHRIRLAMQDPTDGGKLAGEVEVDETFIGGRARNMHKDRRLKAQQDGRNEGGKAIVLGLLERKGRVRAAVVPDRKNKTMQPVVQANVQAGSRIMSDEHGSWWKMDDLYIHEMVNHFEAYVKGNVHTNGIENFWSLLKRTLRGSYISVEPFHLFRYVDEQAFRFNTRQICNDFGRFALALYQIVGKRLTYNELIGKEAETAAY
ncbi:MAG: IS1595 family transposase [Bryobacteraceae bacterium]|jgi:transposase-like protein